MEPPHIHLPELRLEARKSDPRVLPFLPFAFFLGGAFHVRAPTLARTLHLLIVISPGNVCL